MVVHLLHRGLDLEPGLLHQPDLLTLLPAQLLMFNQQAQPLAKRQPLIGASLLLVLLQCLGHPGQFQGVQRPAPSPRLDRLPSHLLLPRDCRACLMGTKSPSPPVSATCSNLTSRLLGYKADS